MNKDKIKEALEVLREFNTSEKATLDIQIDDHNVNCSIEGNTAGLVMIATKLLDVANAESESYLYDEHIQLSVMEYIEIRHSSAPVVEYSRPVENSSAGFLGCMILIVGIIGVFLFGLYSIINCLIKSL